MFNLIKADLYRIFNKKGLYIFSGISTILLLLIVYLVKTPTTTYDDYVMIVSMVVSFSSIIIGAFIVGLVYNDDLKSKSLQSAIGFGMKRSQIVLTKFIVSVFMYSVIFLGFLALVISIPYMFAITVNPDMFNQLITNFGVEALRGIVYIALTSIVVFATQKPTVVTTAFLLLATQTIANIASLVLRMGFIVRTFGNLSKYLPTNAVSQLNMNLYSNLPIGQEIITICIAIIGSIILSIALFNKKELEF